MTRAKKVRFTTVGSRTKKFYYPEFKIGMNFEFDHTGKKAFYFTMGLKYQL